jgi:hypothetical protein
MVGKRFGAAGRARSSPGDWSMVARHGRRSTTVTMQYEVRDGRFSAWGASGRRWGPQGGGGRAEGHRRCDVCMECSKRQTTSARSWVALEDSGLGTARSVATQRTNRSSPVA